ncbi:MAG: beta-N-acetylhexosaminidase [Rhodospirillales bacterium]
MGAPLAAIFGCAGPELTADERAFYRASSPLGFILFARNVQEPDQVRALVSEMRGCVGRDDAPVLIDQEGGRVQRLGPPHWRAAPTAGSIADLHSVDANAGEEAASLNAALIAAELADLGITVDCVPVLDVPQPGSHDVIGDRAVGRTPGQSARLGNIVCGQMIAHGVVPVIKHIPGHGRATVDSHHDLPIVDAPLEELRSVDFAPFRDTAELAWGRPWGMTAHVVYTAIDPNAPATTSATVIADIIRDEIGFEGFLVSDDLSMKALGGSLGDRTTASLAAGCDAVLHCNGEMEEMIAVASAAGALGDTAFARYTATENSRKIFGSSGSSSLDRETTDARIRRLLGKLAA